MGTFNIHGRGVCFVHLWYTIKRRAFQVRRPDPAVFINSLLSLIKGLGIEHSRFQARKDSELHIVCGEPYGKRRKNVLAEE
jgi:hypothetical protein